MSAETQVDTLISNALDKSSAAIDKVITYTETAQTIAQGYSLLNPNPAVVAETFAIPAFTPNLNLATTYKTDFDVIWQDMETWVRGLMNDYVNTYFPVLDPLVQTAQNAWLLSVVNDGYLGIPVAVETAIWDRARSKDMLEAARMEDEAATQFSTRGFSLPPGAMDARLRMVQQAASDKSSTIARDLAIKQTEISIEMTKFAVSEMTKLRLGIAAALADFMRAWMTLPTAAAEIAKAKAEINRTLWDSSANYIQALVAKAGLKLDADKATLSGKVQEDSIWVQNFLGAQKLRVDAATAAADQMGKVAASYANSMNTLGYIGAATNTAA